VVRDEHRSNEEIKVEKVLKIVQSGLQLFESLGLGGMNTRGFGRMKVLNLDN
jgi:CRISPR-associated protein Cmr4